LIPSLVVTAVLFALGVRQVVALIGFWLVAFVCLVTLYEIWRGMYARQRSTGEFLPLALWRLVGKNRRRYGGFIIHLGTMLMAIGILGIELFQQETQGTIAQGQQLKLGAYTVQYNSLAIFDTADGRNVARAVIGVYKGDQFIGELYPRRDYYYEAQQPMTIPGVRSTLEDDLYILLVDWQPVSMQAATFKIFHNPLVNWLWLGGWVFILGTLIAAWPEPDPETVAVKLRKRAAVTAET